MSQYQINIDYNRKCVVCGKAGAEMDNGLCLKCLSQAIAKRAAAERASLKKKYDSGIAPDQKDG